MFFTVFSSWDYFSNLNEYFWFNFELNIELNQFLARFNVKMNNQNVPPTPSHQSLLVHPELTQCKFFRILDNWIVGLFVIYEGKHCIRRKCDFCRFWCRRWQKVADAAGLAKNCAKAWDCQILSQFLVCFYNFLVFYIVCYFVCLLFCLYSFFVCLFVVCLSCTFHFDLWCGRRQKVADGAVLAKSVLQKRRIGRFPPLSLDWVKANVTHLSSLTLTQTIQVMLPYTSVMYLPTSVTAKLATG